MKVYIEQGDSHHQNPVKYIAWKGGENQEKPLPTNKHNEAQALTVATHYLSNSYTPY